MINRDANDGPVCGCSGSIRCSITNIGGNTADILTRLRRQFIYLLKSLQQINNNMNQVAAKANVMNFVDTAKYWANVSELQRAIGSLIEEAYG